MFSINQEVLYKNNKYQVYGIVKKRPHDLKSVDTILYLINKFGREEASMYDVQPAETSSMVDQDGFLMLLKERINDLKDSSERSDVIAYEHNLNLLKIYYPYEVKNA